MGSGRRYQVMVVLDIRLLRDHNLSLARLLVEGVERSA
jgi:hypothetical protein